MRKSVGISTLLLMLGAACLPVAPAIGEDRLLEKARSGAYSAGGLYEPRIVEYDNGLTLIAKRRPGVPSVSVRVRVGLGSAHYECGQQHVPHFLEHMLFGAVPGLSEADFERRVFELGAYSNAYTAGLQTVYELDVYSGSVMDGLDLMADMLTRAEFERESFEKTQKVIWREIGGEPGPVELQSLPGGPLASGIADYAADVSDRYLGGCTEFDGGQSVEFDSVKQAYANYYVPGGMTWIVVGDFDADTLLEWAYDRLGKLPGGKSRAPGNPAVSAPKRSKYVGLAWEPGVMLLARTSGHSGSDHYARAFISHLLDEQLYKRLRLDTALTYTPQSIDWGWGDWGIFGIAAESEEENHDEALEIIREIVDRLVARPLDEREFRTVQLSLLRQWAQSTETNEGYAEHYVGSLFELRRHGSFTNDEVALARLTPERVHEVAQRMFAPDNVVVIRDGDRQARIDAREQGDD